MYIAWEAHRWHPGPFLLERTWREGESTNSAARCVLLLPSQFRHSTMITSITSPNSTYIPQWLHHGMQHSWTATILAASRRATALTFRKARAMQLALLLALPMSHLSCFLSCSYERHISSFPVPASLSPRSSTGSGSILSIMSA